MTKRTGDPDMKATSLKFSHITAYAAPTFCLMFLVGPAQSLIQGVYTQYFGLKLADLASIVLIARIFDAVTDPAIGLISDRTKSKLPGGRKFWVVLGSVVSLCAVFFLFIPQAAVTPGYFFIWFVVCYLGWTLVEIPHLSWGSELSRDYKQKARVFSNRAFFYYLGYIAFLALPFLPIFDEPGYTPQTLVVAFWVVAISFPITVGFAVWHAPQGQPDEQPASSNVFHAFKALTWNPALRNFAAIFIMIGLGIGMQTGVAFLYITSFLGLFSEAPIIFVLSFPLAIIALPLWLWISRTVGKHYGLFGGVALTAVTFIGLAMLRPGPEIFWTFFILNAAIHFFQSSWISIAPSMLGDIIDYDKLKTGQDNSATYYAFYTFIRKVFEGIGGGLGLLIAANYGFEPSELVINEQVIFGMQLVMGFLPATLFVVAAYFSFRFPITAARHAEILEQIKIKEEARSSKS